MPIQVQTTELSDGKLLTLSGKVIGADDTSFRERLERICTGNNGFTAVDVTDVEFIDSHALGILLYCCGMNENVFIVNKSTSGSSYIDKLIEVTDLHLAVSVVGTIDEIKTAQGE